MQDKTGWSTARSGLTGLATGIPSFLLFSTTTGVQVLDVGDAFANNIGVVSWAIAMLLAVGIGSQANSAGTCRVGLIAAVLLSTGRHRRADGEDFRPDDIDALARAVRAEREGDTQDGAPR